MGRMSITRPIELTDAEVNFYNDQGYLVLPGLVARDRAAELRDEVMTVLREVFDLDEARLSKASGKEDALRQTTKYLKDSGLDELINGQNTKAIASRLLGGDARVYMPFTAVKAGGGGGSFHLHQDNQYTRHEPGEGSLNIWVALVDMTPENGCLQVSPHSHKDGYIERKTDEVHGGYITPESEAHRIFPLRMCAGDAVAFTRLTVHGSGPNHTDSPRVAYALQYHRDDVDWIDAKTGERKRLADHPRFAVGPVETLAG